jgi:hypothetical protein
LRLDEENEMKDGEFRKVLDGIAGNIAKAAFAVNALEGNSDTFDEDKSEIAEMLDGIQESIRKANINIGTDKLSLKRPNAGK